MNYKYINKGGHVEVYCNSRFLFSADTEDEARKELEGEDEDESNQFN